MLSCSAAVVIRDPVNGERIKVDIRRLAMCGDMTQSGLCGGGKKDKDESKKDDGTPKDQSDLVRDAAKTTKTSPIKMAYGNVLLEAGVKVPEVDETKDREVTLQFCLLYCIICIHGI